MKNWRISNTSLFVAIVLLSFLAACNGSPYEKLLRKEINSGAKNDSLFLGFELSDTKKEFFEKGWVINQKGIIRQGPKNQTIEYVLQSQKEDGTSIQMLFYPDFDKDLKTKAMDMTFAYNAWSPWNLDLQAEPLQVAVQDTLMSWYGGNPFLLQEFDEPPLKIWYKVDGNRQISMTILDERQVVAVIKDLSHPDNNPYK